MSLGEEFLQAWNNQTKAYPSTPVGDVLGISIQMLQLYASGSGNYDTYQHMDVPGFSMIQCWTRDVDQLMILCDMDVNCRGFNSAGVLKNSTHTMTAAPNSTLYVKRG
jgi:hypothetical protein